MSAHRTRSTSSIARKTKELFRDIFALGKAQELESHPFRPCSSTSSPATRVPLHAVGQSDAQRVRLAAAVLSARRRIRQDLRELMETPNGTSTAPATTRSARIAWRIAASRRPRSKRCGGASVEGHRHRQGRHDNRRAHGAGNIACRASGRRNTCFHVTSIEDGRDPGNRGAAQEGDGSGEARASAIAARCQRADAVSHLTRRHARESRSHAPHRQLPRRKRMPAGRRSRARDGSATSRERPTHAAQMRQRHGDVKCTPMR